MNHFPLVALLLTACGESWTWDATSANKDSGGDTAAPGHDLDGDGFIDIAAGGDDCWDDPISIPAGFEAIAGTAQPAAAEVNPDATETWYDGVDQDCAGDDDFDQDGDTHRSATHADRTGVTGDDCYDAVDDAYPSGTASCARESDLAPGDVFPGASDAAYDGTDADCAGNDDFDQDGDGYGRCDECDDTNAGIYPNDAADPWYDGIDANCDGNDGDQDGDGYYVEGYAFAIPPDFEAGDCADDPASVPASLNGFPTLDAGELHPDAVETWYDGVDQDCAGDGDFDQDADGQATTEWPDGGGALGLDCVDTDASVYAGAADAWYDGVDADCAGNDDFDQDGDGYNSTDDCDDEKSEVNPSAEEDCATTYDNDCDGDTNDLDASGCVVYYADVDGDGYGGAEACLCVATATYMIATGDDCDDADAAVSPAEMEVCNNGVDDNCDGGAGGCALTGGSLSTADAEYAGEAAGDAAGFSVAGAGDVNGDGFDDLLVGAYTNLDGGLDAGAAYVVLGSAAPISGSLSVEVEFLGEMPGDNAGYKVSGAGDVDGDGFDDFVVGAFNNGDGDSGAGAAYLLLGSAAPTAASLSGAIEYVGQGAGDRASSSIAAAGDVNGDGFDDFLVGAPYCDDFASNAGAAYLILGSGVPIGGSLQYTAEYTAEAADNYAGESVAGAGDVDGDGLDDFVVGASYNADGGGGAGAAYLILGVAAPSGGSLSGAIQYTGEAASDRAGGSTSGAGDVNGDGYADVVIGARYNDDGATEAGAAYLVVGTASPLSASLAAAVEYSGEATNDAAGVSVSGAGDVDGDGFDDVLVGAYGNGDYRGAAYLVLGTSTPASAQLSTVAKYPGANQPDYGGFSVAGAGDTNADGYADLLIGAHGNDDGGSAAGAAYLILGQGL